MPRLSARQNVQGTHSMEAGLRNLGEVMVLIVIAHIVCKAVQRAVIRVGLLTLHTQNGSARP